MKSPSFFLFFIVSIWVLLSTSFAQQLSSARKVNWIQAGLPATGMPSFSRVVDVTTRGITINDNSKGSQNSQNLNLLIDTCLKPVIIHFPQGNYYFSSQINVSQNNIFFRGDSSNNTVPTIYFNGNGAGNIFSIRGGMGNMETQAFLFKQTAFKDANYVLKQNSPVSLSASQHFIRIFQNDSSLLVEPPYKVVGQVCDIKSINGDTIFLESGLRKDFTLTDSARFVRITPRIWIGFENFKVVRMDSTASETSNFHFEFAGNCWLRNIESDTTNMAHAYFSNTLNCLLDKVYFHHSFKYGGNPYPQAIGVLLNKATSECRIQNSIFEHLRQAVIFQQGANGNVYAYNYSTDPYWYDAVHDISPTNRAPDINLHGHYPFANLIEGNIAQNILLDREHGEQGPLNTFLRNRAELFGIKVLNLQTNDQNFLGNEVTHDSTFYIHSSGPIQLGDFLINGSSQVTVGNLIRCWIAASSSTCQDTSFAYSSKPAFLTTAQWGGIGWPNTINSNSIPARDRYCVIHGCSVNTIECGTSPGERSSKNLLITRN